MPQISPLELAIVLVIALIVLGPKRLPEVGRSLGRGLREFKETLSGARIDEDDEDDEDENREDLATAAGPARPAREV